VASTPPTRWGCELYYSLPIKITAGKNKILSPSLSAFACVFFPFSFIFPPYRMVFDLASFRFDLSAPQKLFLNHPVPLKSFLVINA
jgi:hypothetical protein